ncbi:autotransporter outer membrane beta-barrel domain-containing protein [Brucella tritici]|uniref:Autotransporter outer membrane beta-barrel domain-containing protein n=1 Tax=Brucella tritici TaxID=94626 RepID=A0A7X6FUG4_9HYPH|nr:autotransporter outer membrane beta-barrel domain-containing protein [Brucella tritici]KAB2667446.1 autotransporter outer membrane beta-barrel domain-containing protein [Brucella tritici]NKW10824.1 autotransporter outer membrane beta-barrel domain-containing protein [Brucella tritici]
MTLIGTASLRNSSNVHVDGILDISATADGLYDLLGIPGGTSVAVLAGNGSILLGARNLTLNEGGSDFAGQISGTGKLIFQQGTSALTGESTYSGGTDIIDARLNTGNAKALGSGTVTMQGNATLDLNGNGQTIAGLSNAGTIKFGTKAGTTLTVAGNYTGNGVIVLNTVLGGDGSPTDRLVITGDTSGSSTLQVNNLKGEGAPTVEGIKIIDVAGSSDGTFSLNGDYEIQGEQAIVAGAYAYQLHKNGKADTTDGDWYLRSTLKPKAADPITPPTSTKPLYQAGAPLYEAYPQVLQALNGLSSLQQRVGDRYWVAQGSDGTIDTEGYGLGATLTWYGNSGTYVDGQVQANWFDSNLSSVTAERGMSDGNKGLGFTVGLETGKRFAAAPNWTLTPQAQLIYSSVDFNSFNDTFGVRVSLKDGDSLNGRLGLSADYHESWQAANGLVSSANVYGIVNLYYEFLDGARTDLAGTGLGIRNERFWGGVGLGNTYSWFGGKYSLYGEGLLKTSLAHPSDSFGENGTVGFKVSF